MLLLILSIFKFLYFCQNPNFGNVKVDQLGFVFKDIEKQAEVMQNILGLSKFLYTPPKTLSIQFRGRQSQVTAQTFISRLGNTQIE